MARIDVACEPTDDGWACRVEVTDNGTSTTHRVGVANRELARLDPGAGDPTELVRRSFVFLLEREPKESILRSFDLPLIGHYFPDWERRIGR